MKIVSLYKEKDSIVHRVDPVTKMLYILVSILIPLILPGHLTALAVLGVTLVLLRIGRVFRNVLPLIGFSSIVLLTVILIQSLFNNANAHVLFSIGGLRFYREGFDYSMTICIRVFSIICAFALLILTARPEEIIQQLAEAGMSPKMGYMLSAVLQIVPQMIATTSVISDSQRARGMETEGKLVTRIKAFVPLISPVVMTSLVNTRERSMALEVRAFSAKGRRSFLKVLKREPYDRAIRIAMLALTVAAVAGRIFLWKR